MKLFAMYSTHGYFSEGGRKTHIANETGKVLCGFDGYFGVTEITEKWIRQSDPENELCQKCKKAALLLVNKKIKT